MVTSNSRRQASLIMAGFFIGPFYPVGLYVLTEAIPQELHVGAIGSYFILHSLESWELTMLIILRLHG